MEKENINYAPPKDFEENARIDAVEKKTDEIYTMLEKLYQEKQSKN